MFRCLKRWEEFYRTDWLGDCYPLGSFFTLHRLFNALWEFNLFLRGVTTTGPGRIGSASIRSSPSKTPNRRLPRKQKNRRLLRDRRKSLDRQGRSNDRNEKFRTKYRLRSGKYFLNERNFRGLRRTEETDKSIPVCKTQPF